MTKYLIPYVCPVCSGKGMLPGNFYNVLQDSVTGNISAIELCRSCRGTGIVWSKEDDEWKK